MLHNLLARVDLNLRDSCREYSGGGFSLSIDRLRSSKTSGRPKKLRTGSLLGCSRRKGLLCIVAEVVSLHWNGPVSYSFEFKASRVLLLSLSVGSITRTCSCSDKIQSRLGSSICLEPTLLSTRSLCWVRGYEGTKVLSLQGSTVERNLHIVPRH